MGDGDEDGPGHGREWIALDLETTGLVAEIDRVVEIGAVRFDASGREIGRFERLVDPERPMSPAAEAIHGISDADLVGAPTSRAVLPEFLDFLGDPSTTALLAHNAVFDAQFLGHELERAGLPRPGHAVIDTLALARRRLPDLIDHRLDTLARLLNLDAEDPHRALADCLRVKGLWLALGGPSEAAEVLIAYPISAPSEPAGSAPIGWDALVAAIARGWKVRMEYTGGTRGDAPREVTPRGFVQRGGVPYLIAFCHLDAFEKAFRLDRVRRYEVVSECGIGTTHAS
jgi:DNA polymerase III epsilon subunit family exonuclease